MESNRPIISSISPMALSAPVGAFMLHLVRDEQHADRTIGKLFVDGVWKWYTLEGAVGVQPLMGLQASEAGIPAALPGGCYQITWALSRTLNVGAVVGFPYARIAAGHAPRTGEILVGGGYVPKTGTLLHSRVALDHVRDDVLAAFDRGRQVWLEIVTAT